MEYLHAPVMADECLRALNIKPDGTYADCTAGLGGHSHRIASLLGGGRLICIDKDESALERCRERMAPFGEKVLFAKSDFRNADKVLRFMDIEKLDGMLLDLGVSSLQLDMPQRGFSYRYDAPLDMRMDQTAGLSALDIVNLWEGERLARIFWEYGEERYSSRIARAIVEKRPVESTAGLVEIIKSAMPAKALREKQHPARRVFQALRIAVNDELGALSDALEKAPGLISRGGRLAVISFHSLEDRLVKNAIRGWEKPCVCPPSFPQCVCGREPVMKSVGRYRPSPEETARNPRAECATLRAAERL